MRNIYSFFKYIQLQWLNNFFQPMQERKIAITVIFNMDFFTVIVSSELAVAFMSQHFFIAYFIIIIYYLL